jgi:hypothetical protein
MNLIGISSDFTQRLHPISGIYFRRDSDVSWFGREIDGDSNAEDGGSIGEKEVLGQGGL